MKVGIIGGGIAGLTTALALKKAGIKFHLFEQSPVFREVGAGILLFPSTKYLLDKLGVGNAIENAAEKIDEIFLTNHKLKKFFTLPTKPVGIVIHRASLINILSTPLEPHEYTLNARIETIDQLTSVTKITVEDKVHEFDVIVAADGIHSPIRKQFLPLVDKRFTQQIAWRGITNVNLPSKYNHTMFELWGNNKRFGIVPSKERGCFWYAIAWEKEAKKVHEATIKADLLKMFDQFDACVHPLIENCNHIITTELFDLPQDKFSWHNNRVVFVGDAIHACTPHLAQGACQSIESAYTLVACLKANTNNFHEAFNVYQQKRMIKVDGICKFSFKAGRFSHQRKPWQDKLVQTTMALLPNTFTRNVLKNAANLSYLDDVDF